MFFKASLVGMMAVALYSAPGFAMGKSSALVQAAQGGASRMSDSAQYNDSLKSLLARNWVLVDGEITVWHMDDPHAPATPDLKEVRAVVVKDANVIEPNEIGLYPGAPLDGIYGGPYTVQAEGKTYVFVLSNDGRTWGSDHNRCFIFYKELEQIRVAGSATSLASIGCSTARAIKNAAIFPRVPGFSDLDDSGKKLLTQLSNEKWRKSIAVQNAFIPDRQIEFTETFQFEFWNDFSTLKYESSYSDPSQSSTAYPSNIQIARIGVRNLGAGVTEFLVWGHRPEFVDQDANLMEFVHANSELWNAKSYDDVKKMRAENPTYYCYQGFDCSKNAEWQKDWGPIEQEVAANYFVLRYDANRPGHLEVRYEMTDPRFSTPPSTVFQAE